jgi:hypothetical protein
MTPNEKCDNPKNKISKIEVIVVLFKYDFISGG